MVKLVRHLLSISTSMLECGQCTVHRVLPPRNTKTELLLRAPAESRRTLFFFFFFFRSALCPVLVLAP